MLSYLPIVKQKSTANDQQFQQTNETNKVLGGVFQAKLEEARETA
jgi:hypothetical protein